MKLQQNILINPSPFRRHYYFGFPSIYAFFPPSSGKKKQQEYAKREKANVGITSEESKTEFERQIDARSSLCQRYTHNLLGGEKSKRAIVKSSEAVRRNDKCEKRSNLCKVSEKMMRRPGSPNQPRHPVPLKFII